MLEMTKGELTVKQLIRVLKEIDNPDEVYVATENVQDGINRHNGIVGFERDESDEYFILKIFNEAKHNKEKLQDAVRKALSWIDSDGVIGSESSREIKIILEEAKQY